MTMENNVTEEEITSGTRSWRDFIKTCWPYILENKFLFSNQAAVILGIALGLTLKAYGHVDSNIQLYIGFPGEMLMRMLQVDTVPLIVTSVIMGVSGLSVHSSRKIALRSTAYILCTTLIAAIIGITLVLVIKPGVAYGSEIEEEQEGEDFSTADALMDLLRNMVPHNLIQACFQQFRTDKTDIETEDYDDNSSMVTNETEVRKEGRYVNGFNTMGLIVWSFVFGVILNKMGEKGKILVEVVTVMNEAITTTIDMIMGYLPVGVMFMIASNVLEIYDWDTIFKLGMFVLVVMIGLVIQGAIVLPLIYFVFTRRSPFAVIRGVFPALMTALVISSSVTAAVASIGAAGLPATGAVTTLFVLAAAGLPAKEASTLVVVEWLLDRCNTAVNVMGNCYGAALIYRVSTQELEHMTRRDATNLENIQVNVNSQASDEDIFHSDASQSEDIGLQILCTPPEYLSDQDSDDQNV